MVTAESVKAGIEAGLACERVEVEGDGEHFQALIVSRSFEGRNRVQRHQLVYKALGDRMRVEIHALSMRTLTPEELAAGG
ncbi:MAG: BolA/IbaG family iron-sulfur metabolism protein [Betaproteobacteria bacterium]|nr:BolA/IbaG family iron-sulfur metabolism protein [Betaproteobacteria bacterium]